MSLAENGLRDAGFGDAHRVLNHRGHRGTQGNTGMRELVYPKLALLNFWRKSGPSIFTMRHISWRRERMRSPMRSPRVSSRVAARAGDSDLATLAAGSSAKFVVIIVVRLSLYRVLRIRLTVSHTHSLGFTAPSSSSNSTSASNTGRST